MACGSAEEPDDGPAESADYDAAGVPWWDGREAHWAGNSMPEDDVASYTATRGAAIFLHDRPQYPEQPGPQGLGTLTALFEDGTTAGLAKHVIGVPMADPTGRVVAWTVKVDDHTATLVAYDTREREELGSQRIEGEVAELNAVRSVVGDTVSFASGGRLLAWRPLDPDSPLVELERPEEPTFGTPSPDGRFLVTVTDDEEDDDRVVVDASTEETAELDLPEDRTIYQARWAADGSLVAATVSARDLADGWDDGHAVASYACDVGAGECRELDGGPQYVGALALFEDNSVGQFSVSFENSGLS